jgi:hypothetical protein
MLNIIDRSIQHKQPEICITEPEYPNDSQCELLQMQEVSENAALFSPTIFDWEIVLDHYISEIRHLQVRPDGKLTEPYTVSYLGSLIEKIKLIVDGTIFNQKDFEKHIDNRATEWTNNSYQWWQNLLHSHEPYEWLCNNNPKITISDLELDKQMAHLYDRNPDLHSFCSKMIVGRSKKLLRKKERYKLWREFSILPIKPGPFVFNQDEFATLLAEWMSYLILTIKNIHAGQEDYTNYLMAAISATRIRTIVAAEAMTGERIADMIDLVDLYQGVDVGMHWLMRFLNSDIPESWIEKCRQLKQT